MFAFRGTSTVLDTAMKPCPAVPSQPCLHSVMLVTWMSAFHRQGRESPEKEYPTQDHMICGRRGSPGGPRLSVWEPGHLANVLSSIPRVALEPFAFARFRTGSPTPQPCIRLEQQAGPRLCLLPLPLSPAPPGSACG